MAELNFGLLTPPGSQSIGNAFVTGMDQASAARAQENQNALAQYTLSKAKREDELTNQLLGDLRSATTNDEIYRAYQRAGKGDVAFKLRGEALTQDKTRLEIAGLPGTQAKTAAETQKLVNESRNKAIGEVAGFPDVESALAAIDARLASKIIDQATADQMRQGLTPENFPKWKLETLTRLLTPEKQLEFAAPEKPSAPPSMVAEYTFAKTPAGGGFRGSFQDFVRERAAAARPPAQPRPEQPPVSVVDPDTGKQVLVSRDEAIARRMTPANAAEGLAPKEIQKREAAFPAATSAVNGFEKKSDDFIKDLIALRDDAGLDQITGPIYGRIGSVSRAGSRAQALYDKIVAKGGFQALQDLRDASKTGGALGNVSNQEGNQLKASFAAIDRRQAAEDVQAAINQVIADIEGARTRTREAYDSTYSYKSEAGQAPPAGAGKPSLADIFGGKKP